MSTGEDADRALASWAERLQRVDDNLLALEAEPTYQMLAGLSGARAPLDGTTAARVVPALAALADLFEYRQRIGDVLERANAIRVAMSNLAFWENDEKLREIRALLEGPSIRLGTASRPLAERGLLDRSGEDIVASPEQLLGAMVRAFEIARDVVLSVKRAWAELDPLLERLEQEIATLGDLARGMGDTTGLESELEALRGELARARANLARDPLGIGSAAVENFAPRVGHIGERVRQLEAQRQQLVQDLAHCAELRRTLGETHRQARAATVRARTEMSRAVLPAMVGEEQLDGLDAWREKLEAVAASGRWASAAIGLVRWSDACRGYLQADRAVLTAWHALESAKTELEGRFSARVAQAEAFRARGMVMSAKVEELARTAKAVLATEPLDLDAARGAVDAFERTLVTLGRGH